MATTLNFEAGYPLRISQTRKALGLTQKEVAVAVGVNPLTIIHWEKGRQPPANFIFKLGEVLKCDPLWIVTGKESDIQRHIDVAVAAMKEEIKSDLGLAMPQIRMPERRPKRINRREELPRYHISKTGKGMKLPQWLNLAAGHGCDLEKSEDYVYLEENQGKAGLHTATVRGRSMEDTLVPGDMIVLEEFGGGPIMLSPRGDDPKNSYRVLNARVPQDAICVLSINDDAPTLKRISYDFSRGMMDWRLMILAENMIEWAPRAVSRNDSVTFYAKMVGIVDRSQPGAGI